MSEIDPKKNVHVRTQNNPFSIFHSSRKNSQRSRGSELPPPIPTASGKSPKTRGSSSASSSGGLFAAPKASSASSSSTSRQLPPNIASSFISPVIRASVKRDKTNADVDPPDIFAALPPVMSPPAREQPPPPPPAQVMAGDEDDSFDERDNDELLVTLEKRCLAAEMKELQSRDELLKLRSALKESRNREKMLVEKLKKAKEKEVEENRDLEEALTGIEKQLAAATQRAIAAETESASLRQKLAAYEEQGAGDVTMRHKKMKEQAKHMSDGFEQAAKNARMSLKDLMAGVQDLERLAVILRDMGRVISDEM